MDEDRVTEDRVTEDRVTEDRVTEDRVTEDRVDASQLDEDQVVATAPGGPVPGGPPGDDVVRWRPGTARTVRGTRSLQLGVGPGARVLDGLTAADWTLLTLLERAPRRRDLMAATDRLGLPRRRCEQLLRLLTSCGALAAEVEDGHDGWRALGGKSDRAGPPVAAGASVAARPSAGAGSSAGAGRALTGSLAGAAVAVVGGGGLGIVLTVALAAAGAAVSALVDDATVAAGDVLPGGATRTDVGRRAAHVAAEAVHRTAPDVRTACPSDPDLVVLVSSQVSDAPAGIPLVQSGTLHLPVVVRTDDVVVGPLVVPGRGACLHCLDLHQRDLDPGWPAAALLLRREARRVRTPPAVTAALVQGLVPALAGAPQVLLRAGVEVHVEPSGATSWHRWSPHPACGCVGWPDPDPGPGPDGPGRRLRADPPAPGRRSGATMAA